MGPTVLLIPMVIYLVLAEYERRLDAQIAAFERLEFIRTLERLDRFGPPQPVIDLVARQTESPVQPQSVAETSPLDQVPDPGHARRRDALRLDR